MDDQTNIINQDGTLKGTNTKASGAETPSVQETTTPVAAQPTTSAPKNDDAQKAVDSVQSPDQPSTDNPSAPAFSERVKLDLSADEADMIQALLSNYVLAYRSDSSVDYKPEPVPREKVGHFPYVATAPAPEIINPAYDWINKKWYSKNGTQDLSVVAEKVANLSKKSAEQEQNALAHVQQTQMITKQLGNQTTMMKQMQQTLAILAKGSQAQPTAQTQPTTDNKQTSKAETTNGGNN